MCARLLACPLCSQPGFLTLDALRAGLVSVATRPLVCPVCNEVLLGIDKLTIHLFGHTINLSNNNATESTKHHANVVAPDERLIAVHNLHNVAPQNWNAQVKAQQSSKTQASSDSSETRTESTSSSGGTSTSAGTKIHAVNSQSQTQSRDLLEKGLTRQLVPDYNYDVIKIDILPQPNENPNVTLGPTASLRQVLKTHCAARSFCNGDIKRPNVAQENVEGVQGRTTPDFADGWTEKQSCGPPAAAKVTSTVDADVYRDIEASCVEPGNGPLVAKEAEPMMSLMNKENGLSDFQSIQDAMPSCRVDASSLEQQQRRHNDKQNPRDETEDPDHSSKEQRRILAAQTCAKMFQGATPKEKTERCDICGFHFPDVNILALHQQLVHEQESGNVPGKVLKNYSCHLCSKVFKMKGSLMVHMRVVHIGCNLGKSQARSSLSVRDPIVHSYNCIYYAQVPYPKTAKWNWRRVMSASATTAPRAGSDSRK